MSRVEKRPGTGYNHTFPHVASDTKVCTKHRIFVHPIASIDKHARNDTAAPRPVDPSEIGSGERGRLQGVVAFHHALVLWAASCADRALPIFGEQRPGDDRPRVAIAEGMTFRPERHPFAGRSRPTRLGRLGRRHGARYCILLSGAARPAPRIRIPKESCSRISRTARVRSST
ncbi:putative immunity protein [Cryobacterium zongtaii]|uniref:putative immunity protein n=1 Tax=Cryobacterium zongtaii TaxID=1259217 RepID=UPI003CC57A07